jgi:hypothetical protein
LGERSLLDLRQLVAQAAETERNAVTQTAREMVDATVSAGGERSQHAGRDCMAMNAGQSFGVAVSTQLTLSSLIRCSSNPSKT